MNKILRKLGNNSGLAQIPLIVGLLIMAVAIPVATKLSQQNQNIENQAAGCVPSTCQAQCEQLGKDGVCDPFCRCVSAGGGECNDGEWKCLDDTEYQKCDNGKWSVKKKCASTRVCSEKKDACVAPEDETPPTPTKVPTAVPTLPSATCATYNFSASVCESNAQCNYDSANKKCFECVANGNTAYGLSECCSLKGSFVSGLNKYICGQEPTAVPTKVPTAVPTGIYCGASKACPSGWYCNGEFVYSGTRECTRSCTLGEACTMSDGRSGVCRSTGASSGVTATCQASTKKFVGDACSSGDECTTGKCEWATNKKMCVDPTGETGNLWKGGTTCSQDSLCNSGKCTNGRCEPVKTDCTWFTNVIKNGETKCFNGLGGVVSQTVKCTSGKTNVVKTYLVKDCKLGSVGDTCVLTSDCTAGLKCEIVGLDSNANGAILRRCVDPSGSSGSYKKGGEACTSDVQCNSGKCTNDHCEPLANGQSCMNYSQCASGVCIGSAEEKAVGKGTCANANDCTWFNNVIKNGETKCFNGLGGVVSQTVKCTSGKTNVVKTYLVKDCKEDDCLKNTGKDCYTNILSDWNFGMVKCSDCCGGRYETYYAAETVFRNKCLGGGSVTSTPKPTIKLTSTPKPTIKLTSTPVVTVSPKATVTPIVLPKCKTTSGARCATQCYSNEVMLKHDGSETTGWHDCSAFNYICCVPKTAATVTPKPTAVVKPVTPCTLGDKKCSSQTLRMECVYNDERQIREWGYFGCPSGYECDSTDGTCRNTSGQAPPLQSCTGDRSYCQSGTYRRYCDGQNWKQEWCADGCDSATGKCLVVPSCSGDGLVGRPGDNACLDSKTRLHCPSTGGIWTKYTCDVECRNGVCSGQKMDPDPLPPKCTDGRIETLKCGQSGRVESANCLNAITFNCASNQVGVIERRPDCQCKAVCLNSASCQSGDGTVPPTATPTTGNGGGWTAPTATPTSTSGGGGGSPKCKTCPKEFKCYTYGSEYRWFVDGYVMDGFNLNTGSGCGGVDKPSYLGKVKGDANCDGYIDGADYSVWRKEYVDISQGEPVKRSTWEADFTGNDGTCDGYVDGYDYSLWRKQYKDLNGGSN